MSAFGLGGHFDHDAMPMAGHAALIAGETETGVGSATAAAPAPAVGAGAATTPPPATRGAARPAPATANARPAPTPAVPVPSTQDPAQHATWTQVSSAASDKTDQEALDIEWIEHLPQNLRDSIDSQFSEKVRANAVAKNLSKSAKKTEEEF
jgi:hypothetical protein